MNSGYFWLDNLYVKASGRNWGVNGTLVAVGLPERQDIDLFPYTLGLAASDLAVTNVTFQAPNTQRWSPKGVCLNNPGSTLLLRGLHLHFSAFQLVTHAFNVGGS